MAESRISLARPIALPHRWLNQPVLPFLSKELGADNVIFGYFQSFNQLAQMVGAPLIGRLIDVRGAKTALLVSHAAACVSYLLLWRADSIFLLFASQVPSVLMAAMHSSQAYITLVSRWEDRAAQLGRVALSYGVGFLFGPMVGGTLSKYIGYHAIALIGCVGSACVCVAMAVLLPAVAPVARVPQEESEDPEPSATSTFTSTKGWLTAAHLLASPSIRAMVLIKFFLATALAIYRTSFTLYAKDVRPTTANPPRARARTQQHSTESFLAQRADLFSLSFSSLMFLSPRGSTSVWTRSITASS